MLVRWSVHTVSQVNLKPSLLSKRPISIRLRGQFAPSCKYFWRSTWYIISHDWTGAGCLGLTLVSSGVYVFLRLAFGGRYTADDFLVIFWQRVLGPCTGIMMLIWIPWLYCPRSNHVEFRVRFETRSTEGKGVGEPLLQGYLVVIRGMCR